jgi:basic membrane protein A
MRVTRRVFLGGVGAAMASGLALKTARAADPKVAIVMPGNITDKSWTQAGYEGLMRIKEELGLETAYSEKVAQPDQAEAMADYARRGYNIVIGHGGEFQEAANRVAADFPEAMFVVHNGTEFGGNIATLDFAYRQFGYALGHIAGKMSKSGKAGFVGAQKIKFSTDLVESYTNAFQKATNGGEVLVAWTNDWDDIAKGKEAALNQLSQGADVVFPTMDNAAIGSLQALQEKGAWGFGLYYDAIVDWPNTVLQSAIMDIKSAMVDVIKLAKDGKLEPVNYKFGINKPDPSAGRLGTFHSAIPAEVVAEVNKLVEDMMAGSFVP